MPPHGKLHELEPNFLSFHCPGCGYGHAVPVNGKTTKDSDGRDVSWTWNGSYDNPTFQPSLLINKAKMGDYPRCHSFITDGKIIFLNDSTHHLAGQTIEMENCED